MVAIMRDASVVIGTYTEVLAKTGFYAGQQAIVTDLNRAKMFWSGSTWLWETFFQVIARLRVNVTAPEDLLENQLWLTTLPKFGSEDIGRLAGFISVPNNSNAKTIRVNLGTAGSMAPGLQTDIASGGAFNLVTEFRNQADAAAQEWFSNNKAIFGSTGGTVSATTKDLATAGKLLSVTAQKGVAADALVLHWLDFSICGAGVP